MFDKIREIRECGMDDKTRNGFIILFMFIVVGFGVFLVFSEQGEYNASKVKQYNKSITDGETFTIKKKDLCLATSKSNYDEFNQKLYNKDTDGIKGMFMLDKIIPLRVGDKVVVKDVKGLNTVILDYNGKTVYCDMETLRDYTE